MGASVLLARRDLANTKAAYRFLGNERVSEADVLAGYFRSTRERAAASDGPIFVLRDTTEFTYHGEDAETIGATKSVNSGPSKDRGPRVPMVCGILMHSSLH